MRYAVVIDADLEKIMPRKPSPVASLSPGTKERVRFTFEPDRNSPNGVAFSWLIHKAYDGKEKAGTAVRAFWLPFAQRDRGDQSEAELGELVQQCIWRLEEQIQFLREKFDLDAPTRPTPPSSISTEEVTESREAESVAFLNSGMLGVDPDLLNDFSDVLG